MKKYSNFNTYKIIFKIFYRNRIVKYLLVFVLLALIIGLFSSSCRVNEQAQKSLIILVENRLVSLIDSSIQQYKSDLTKEGYFVKVESKIGADTPPEKIRELLQDEYDNNANLTGAVFIGNISAPLYNKKKNQGDPYWHNYLSDFYYMDLDGIWEDTDDNGVLDQHMDSRFNFWSKIKRKLNLGDNRTPEIWISRIRADKLISFGDENLLLRDYFKKNHEYRTGKMMLPPKRAFVVSAGVDVLKSDWGANPGKIYSELEIQQFHRNLGDSLRKILRSEVGYEWGVINVFSGPRIHHFNHFYKSFDPDLWKSKKGKEQIVKYSDEISDSIDISWLDIKSIQPKVLFYHLLTSEVGRHDYPDYLGGGYIFSGLGLSAIAGTQHSGSVGTHVLYDELALGKSIGEAWKNALVWLVEHTEDTITIRYFPDEKELTSVGKSNYKAVLIGDGTLKLPERK